MSGRAQAGSARAGRVHASIFAALGDETRLSLIQNLCGESPLSISQLTARSTLTRTGISKHLRVLQDAGIVSSVRVGRESLYELKSKPIDTIRGYLDEVSRQWDGPLGRLKSFVERDPS